MSFSSRMSWENTSTAPRRSGLKKSRSQRSTLWGTDLWDRVGTMPPAATGRDQPKSRSTDWGTALAWLSMAVPACCRIWFLVNEVIS